jgi:hypothetical protein
MGARWVKRRNALNSAGPTQHQPSTKQLGYETVCWTNRSFEALVASLGRLEYLGILESSSPNEFRTRIEHLRACIDYRVIESLQEQEFADAVRLDRTEDELEKQRKDPDDVILEARERRPQIERQIVELKGALRRTGDFQSRPRNSQARRR